MKYGYLVVGAGLFGATFAHQANKLGKKVLVIDATKMQKARYIVPTMSPTKSYITRFENIDIAVGFETYQEIERYIGQTENRNTFINTGWNLGNY